MTLGVGGPKEYLERYPLRVAHWWCSPSDPDVWIVAGMRWTATPLETLL